VHKFAEQSFVFVVDVLDFVFGEVAGFALANLALFFFFLDVHQSSPLRDFSSTTSTTGEPSGAGAGGMPQGFSTTVSHRSTFSLMRKRFSSSAGSAASAS